MVRSGSGIPGSSIPVSGIPGSRYSRFWCVSSDIPGSGILCSDIPGSGILCPHISGSGMRTLAGLAASPWSS